MIFRDAQTDLFKPQLEGSKKEILQQVARKAAICNACIHSKNRVKSVFGEGNVNADIMLVGEAPGYNENKTGRPFVGAAGKLLDKILAAKEVHLKRSDIYICNVLKCRPKNNGDPGMVSVKECRNFLVDQIQTVSPKVIIAAGNWALIGIFGTKFEGITNEAREQNIRSYLGIPVLPVFHPAAILYSQDTNPTMCSEQKRITWEVWKKAIAITKGESYETVS